MNTLGETDEGKARLSVWPVYMMSGIIGLFSLSFLSWVWFAPELAHMYAEYPQQFQQLSPGAHQFASMMQQLAPYAPLFGVYGLFGIVTAIGTALTRSWAWWCLAIWLGGVLFWHLFLVISMARFSPTGTLFTVSLIAVFTWLLATRRRLFFPPKPEREE